MGVLQIVDHLGIEIENLFLDPRFGAADPNTAYDVSGDGTPVVTRSTAEQWIGDGTASFALGGGTETTMKQDITVTATPYTIQAMVKRTGGGVVTSSEFQFRFDSADVNPDSIIARRKNWYLCVFTATPTVGSREFGIQALEEGLLTDAWMITNNAFRVTYFDGSTVGNRLDGFRWNGVANFATSTLHKQERSAGRVLDIEDDLSVESVTSIQGWGQPNPNNVLLSAALLDGAEWQNVKRPERYIDLALLWQGISLEDVLEKMGVILAATAIKKTTPTQPFELRFSGANEVVKIKARYAGGISGGDPDKFVMQEAMRLLCPNIFWRGLGNDSATLTTQQAGTNFFIALRRSDGSFTNLGGANGTIKDIIRDAVGNILVCGDATDIDGVTVNRIAKYTISTGLWSDIGNANLNDTVHRLAFDSAGLLYAVGEFDNVLRFFIVRSLAGTWTEPDAGNVLDNSAFALSVDSNDNVLFGGLFTTAGPANTNKIAMLSGGSKVAVGTGLNDEVLDMASDSQGNTYIVGKFLSPIDHFAKFDGSTLTEENQGLNDDMFAIHLVNDTLMYLSGIADSSPAGGGPFTGIIQYDTVDFVDLGAELGNNSSVAVQALTTDSKGNLYIGSRGFIGWTTIGGNTVTDGLATFNSREYEPINISYSGNPVIGSFNWYDNGTPLGELAIGTDTGGVTLEGITEVSFLGSQISTTLKITGNGQLLTISNLTTETRIDFVDLVIVTGEIITITSTSITSDVNGDLKTKIKQGQGLLSFKVQKGPNEIGVFINDGGSTAVATWKNLYLSPTDVP